MIFRTSIAVAAIVSALQSAIAAPPPVEHFARLPFLRQVEVAPGGKYISAKVAADGRYRATVFENTANGLEGVYGALEDDELWVRRFRWVNKDRLVMSIGFNGSRYGTDTVESRLFGLSVGDELEPLFRTKRNENPVQFEDDVVSWIDQDPEHILLQYRETSTSKYPGVFRAPVNKRGIHGRVQNTRQGIYDWHADARGTVRAGRGFKDDAEKQQKLIIRLDKKDRWRDISHRLAEGAPDFFLRGFSERPNIAFVESGHEFDPPALYEYDIETDSFPKLILRDENSEIGSLFLDPTTGKLRGIGYGEEGNRIEWIDEELQAEIKRIRKQFSSQTVSLQSESIDQLTAVYDISDIAEPSRYYLFNRAEPRLTKLPSLYPELDDYALAEIFTATYAARDGLEIPAYVTLPAGATSLADVKNAPFIVLPHGGPTSRDFLRFDYWTQFFASRGYGVLQMNFRGSAGFGQAFREAGDKEWGEAMQDDITDGAQWLIDEGYANKNRIAILGGSYGGYAALMGAVKTPDLYQCAISFAGVTDLPEIIDSARDYIGGRAGTRHIGNLWKDRGKLRENSPTRRADAISIPILLVHGEDDRTVDIKQSRKMRNALNRAKKNVTFIELPKGDHHLSLYANRLKFLQETESFLGDCLN